MNAPSVPTDALATLPAELAEIGLASQATEIFCATAAAWHIRLVIQGRQFDARYDERDGLRCDEVTPGRERHFLSPDMPPNLHSPARLRMEALRRIKYALQHPEYEVAQPPVI
jgi:hypothetical protein